MKILAWRVGWVEYHVAVVMELLFEKVNHVVELIANRNQYLCGPDLVKIKIDLGSTQLIQWDHIYIQYANLTHCPPGNKIRYTWFPRLGHSPTLKKNKFRKSEKNSSTVEKSIKKNQQKYVSVRIVRLLELLDWYYLGKGGKLLPDLIFFWHRSALLPKVSWQKSTPVVGVCGEKICGEREKCTLFHRMI